MKIVIDARESGTSTGRYIDKLIEYLHILQPAYDIVVVTKPQRVDFMRKIAPNFKVVKTPYKEFTFGEQLGFKRQLQRLKPDLVHFGMTQQPVWYRGRVVTTIHDLTTLRFRNPAKNPLVYSIKQQIYKWVTKRVAQKSTRIIVPTEFVKHDVMQFTRLPADKLIVTHESADKITDKPVVFEAVATSKRFLLYVGRPQPHKNLERLIDAYSVVKQSQPSLQLVLAGKFDAAYQKLKDYAKDGLVEDVIFTDWVSDGQLRWLYEQATAYVFPSLSEGFGLPGLEAMQYDLPVISSNATCLPEVYGNAVVYFNPLNVQAMATAINQVLSDEGLRRGLAARGRQQLTKYSWRRMAEQTLAVYDMTLKS